MKEKLSEFMEAGRFRSGQLASQQGKSYGGFQVNGPWGGKMVIVSSGDSGSNPDADGWEHVSVSFDNRAPSWREMCWVKDQFWDGDECVIQFHPPENVYVNVHPFCLHLWRHKDGHTTPPKWMIG